MAAVSPKKRSLQELQDKFKDLTKQTADEQQELFLKSFIFSLPDWKEVETLNKEYKKYIAESAEPGKNDLNYVQAADFLQKHGMERSAMERKAEIKDIDLDSNQRICFIEYLLLHYKKMILEEYYKRTQEKCPHDLSRNGVGVSGVGYELLDELFTVKNGLPPELIAALEELTRQKKVREDEMKRLAEEAAKGGVKGGVAAQKLAQMKNEGTSEEMLKTEAKINSAMRKSAKGGADQALQKKKDAEAREKKKKEEASKANLKAKASLWEGKQ